MSSSSSLESRTLFAYAVCSFAYLRSFFFSASSAHLLFHDWERSELWFHPL